MVAERHYTLKEFLHPSVLCNNNHNNNNNNNNHKGFTNSAALISTIATQSTKDNDKVAKISLTRNTEVRIMVIGDVVF